MGVQTKVLDKKNPISLSLPCSLIEQLKQMQNPDQNLSAFVEDIIRQGLAQPANNAGVYSEESMRIALLGYRLYKEQCENAKKYPLSFLGVAPEYITAITKKYNTDEVQIIKGLVSSDLILSNL